jgi:hypothetical protein
MSMLWNRCLVLLMYFANLALVNPVIVFSLPGQQEVEMGERVDPDSGAANRRRLPTRPRRA